MQLINTLKQKTWLKILSGDDALEDTLIAFKNDLDKNIWMLQAFIGKEALEDDDALDEDGD